MKILVTGGAGYIGSVLVGTLLDAGHRVTVLDAGLYGATSLLGYCHRPEFRFVRGDSRDERALAPLVRGVDAILPLAAIVGQKACDLDPWRATGTNLEAIRLLLKIRARAQTVVFPCTNSGYGRTTGEVYCTEKTPLDPISHYGRTKVEAERAVLESGNAVSLRFATIFGVSPRLRLDLLVNDFVYRARFERVLVLFEGHFKRNYLHVRDAADAFLHVLEHRDRFADGPYNAGLDAANLSKTELAEAIRRHLPDLAIVHSEVGSDPDKRNYIVSNEKIGRTGWTAKRSIDEGIRELLAAFEMLPAKPCYNA